MTTHRSAQWAAAAALFDRLLELPASDRERQLLACTDISVRNQVRAMLDALDREPDYLEHAPQLEPTSIPFDAGSLAAGTPIGAFVIERLIGRGGMGEVYLAQRSDVGFKQ